MEYGEFSYVYDKFMDIDYLLWADYIESLWHRHGVKPKLILDLACGTGNLTIPLAEKKYDMIGADKSFEMLSVAKMKTPKKLNILYLCQDMRELELYGTVDICVSAVDGMNYLLTDGDFSKTLRLVHNYLNPGGLFIFDMNTSYKFENILADASFCEAIDNAAFIWENYYDKDNKINEYYINVFNKDDKTSLYRRFEETHLQRAYEPEEIESLLEACGFSLLEALDRLKYEKYSEKSEKIFFVAKKSL